jgi:hypothetical protein
MKNRLFTTLSIAVLVASSAQVALPALAKKSAASTAAPAAAASKAPLSLKVVSVSSPVKAGSDASASVQTDANAMCTISVKYKSGAATAAGLKAQRADKDGKASWTWKVAKNCSPGEWPVEFTASSKGSKATASSTLKVEK